MTDPVPGTMDKMGRSMMPQLQIDIVRCEAYETCMLMKPGDTSNIGGSGLGYLWFFSSMTRPISFSFGIRDPIRVG